VITAAPVIESGLGMAPITPSVIGVARPAARPWPAPVMALLIRTVLFAAFQALIALFMALAGQAAPWTA